jgi:hypothetical protein
MECSVDECGSPAAKRGMCNKHYLRWRRYGSVETVLIRKYSPGETCEVEDCSTPPLALGLCRSHYERNAKYGSPTYQPTPRMRDDGTQVPNAPPNKWTRPVWPDRFWAKVQRGPGCWQWLGTATKKNDGYGQIRLNGRMVVAHRVAYELVIGPVPPGKSIDHLCRNRLCVNPAHLEAVSPYENFLRGQSPLVDRRRQTHCKRGHPLSGENLRIEKTGSRRCVTCWKAQKKVYR